MAPEYYRFCLRQNPRIGRIGIPKLIQQGFGLGQIAVLYRAAWLGDKVAEVLKNANIPFVRTDTN
ncbi:hypothetical protein ACEQ6A_35330, partial [Rhizobium brockwellii]|uniref:hypothetical protein n=1 Tax=Rhizobium brockwellii TaxID=3019932 RepID=UPI003F944382